MHARKLDSARQADRQTKKKLRREAALKAENVYGNLLFLRSIFRQSQAEG
jgi:hypothetical protein